jgi:hypothetical protein
LTDLDKHVDAFARAVATVGVDFIDAFTFQTFFSPRGGAKKIVESPSGNGMVQVEHIGPNESHGFDLRQFVDAFLARFPAWKSLEHGKGLGFNYQASAHAKMAWMAFVMDIRRAEGLATLPSPPPSSPRPLPRCQATPASRSFGSPTHCPATVSSR